jgi:hypothetical protein
MAATFRLNLRPVAGGIPHHGQSPGDAQKSDWRDQPEFGMVRKKLVTV